MTKINKNLKDYKDFLETDTKFTILSLIPLVHQFLAAHFFRPLRRGTVK